MNCLRGNGSNSSQGAQRGFSPLCAARRRRAGLVLAAVSLLNSACYTYTPMLTVSPQPGQKVAIDISDQGRVRMGDQLGASVSRLEGTLNEVTPDAYMLSVTKVKYFGAPASNWTGERVQLSRDAVARMQERKFSKGRTLLATGIAVAGFALLVGSRTLFGFAREPGDTPPKNPPGDQ